MLPSLDGVRDIDPKMYNGDTYLTTDDADPQT